MSLQRKFWLAFRIRNLVAGMWPEAPEELGHKILQLIDLHLQEEAETEKRKLTKTDNQANGKPEQR